MRLWNRDFTKTHILPRHPNPTLKSSLLYLPDKDRRLRKLYNTLVMLIYLMNKICGENSWKERLKNLIAARKIDTKKMGFPPNWQNRKIWQ